MKLIGRMTLMTVVFMIAMSFGFMSPMMFGDSLKGATHNGTTGLVIELTDYNKTYRVGEDGSATEFTGSPVEGGEETTANGYKLPTPAVKNTSGGDAGATLDVEVRNAAGQKQTVYKATSGNLFYLLESDTTSGVYTITYIATSSDSSATTATRNVTLNIVADAVSFDFDENSPQVIPTIAYAGETIVFPNPTIVDEDGEAIADANFAMTITKGDNTTVSPEVNGEGFRTYTITDEDYGDFVVTYTATVNGNNLSQSFTFRVQKNKQDVTLEYSGWSQSLETFPLEVGVQATLPTPTVVNADANDAEVTDVYTEITIYRQDASAQSGWVEVYNDTDYEGFTPSQEGTYRIDYVTRDFHGNSVEYTITRADVSLTSSSISAKVVDDYETTNTEELDIDEMENVDYRIPSVVYMDNAQTGVTVEFPAIYAEGGWGDYSNLILTRTIWNSGSSSQIATLENEDKQEGEGKYMPNETASYTFTSAGTYEVRYRAQYADEDGKAITGTIFTLDSYTIEVREGSAPETTNLILSTPSVTTAVMKNDAETITFNAPVVTDDDDENIEVHVQYTFASDPKAADGVTWYDATLNDDGTYSIDVVNPNGSDTAWDAATKMTVRFTAYSDLYYKTQGENFKKSEDKVVQLIDYSEDTTAPSLTGFSGQISYDDVAQTVSVPTVSFTNTGSAENETNISLVLYVLDSEGAVMDTYNARTGKTATINGFTYTPVKEGDYTFLYVATDQNNNVSTFSMTCNVDFTLGYSVTVDPITSAEYGDIIDLPSYIHVTDDGRTINIQDANIILEPNTIANQEELNEFISTEITEDVTGAGGYAGTLIIQIQGAYEEVPGLAGRIKCLEGDISIKAWAVNTENYCDYTNNSSTTITFNSTDSTAPSFRIEGESDGNTVIGRYDFDSTNSENNPTITVPWFDASSIVENGSGVDLSTMKIELTYPNASTPFKTFTSADLDTEAGLTFTPDREGKITVVYSISDYQGNTNSRTFTIEVGDVIAPEIVVADDAITAPTKAGSDSQFIIDLSKIDIIEDDSTLNFVDDVEVTITLNGEEFTDWAYSDDDSRIEFTASTSGTYAISFSVTDDAGNVSRTVTKTIPISADSPNYMNTTTIWGTVLIVVSLVILGLVIFFFVKPSKSKTKTTKSTTQKTTNKK